jgi:hypothetical protein
MTSRTHTPEDVKKIDDEFKSVLNTRLFKEKKEWVGLTDEEREEIALELPIDAVRITEAKLKEKNT